MRLRMRGEGGAAHLEEGRAVVREEVLLQPRPLAGEEARARRQLRQDGGHAHTTRKRRLHTTGTLSPAAGRAR